MAATEHVYHRVELEEALGSIGLAYLRGLR